MPEIDSGVRQYQDLCQKDSAAQTRKEEPAACMELPRYICHKKVWALKIAGIAFDIDKAREQNCETDGSATLTPENTSYAPFKVDDGWLQRNPKLAVGGYYVVYERMPGETESYTAYSPASAFENGYTLI